MFALVEVAAASPGEVAAERKVALGCNVTEEFAEVGAPVGPLANSIDDEAELVASGAGPRLRVACRRILLTPGGTPASWSSSISFLAFLCETLEMLRKVSDNVATTCLRPSIST